MKILLIILITWMIWFIVGCIVLSYMDDKDQRLFNWAKNCPLPGGYALTVTAWPIIVYYIWRKRLDENNQTKC